jgi:hypothetical protein
MISSECEVKLYEEHILVGLGVVKYTTRMPAVIAMLVKAVKLMKNLIKTDTKWIILDLIKIDVNYSKNRRQTLLCYLNLASR